MLKLMLVAGAGGFFGTCLRYLSGKLFHWLAPASAFPWSTLTVNVVGSLLIGIFYGLADRHNMLTPAMNVFLITGFCGGLTTFSSFADDLSCSCKAANSSTSPSTSSAAWHWDC